MPFKQGFIFRVIGDAVSGYSIYKKVNWQTTNRVVKILGSDDSNIDFSDSTNDNLVVKCKNSDPTLYLFFAYIRTY